MVDLNALSSKDKIEINEIVTFPDNYKEGIIKDYKDIKVNGYAYLNADENYAVNIDVTGTIFVNDTNTLEIIPLELDFNIDDEIDKNTINDINMLDLVELLWQNIVLEVPIRYTKNDAMKSSGDNWELNGDGNKEIDPRLAKLLDYNKGGE